MADPSFRRGLVLFVALRLLLSLWAIISVGVNPIPEEADEVLRPYLGEPRLEHGTLGLVLGPWQRFDVQRYMHIARLGYVNQENSVFPPLFPLAVRLLGSLFGSGSTANLVAGMVIANVACLGLFIMFHRFVTAEMGGRVANRALVYLALFPTAFFLFAPYTESLFMLFALGSLWSAKSGNYWRAGVLGFLASSTRLTGWILVIPLAYEFWSQRWHSREANESRATARRQLARPQFLAIALPGIALAAFIMWRAWAGLPPITEIYEQYWYQRTGIPGADLFSAVQTLFFGGMARTGDKIALTLDLCATLLLLVTTIYSFKTLGKTMGLYSAALLFFMLLPTSELKPLYSYSRYALAYFPTFMILGKTGQRGLVHRLILYPFILMYLYFSGQFFAWGWVA